MKLLTLTASAACLFVFTATLSAEVYTFTFQNATTGSTGLMPITGSFDFDFTAEQFTNVNIQVGADPGAGAPAYDDVSAGPIALGPYYALNLPDFFIQFIGTTALLAAPANEGENTYSLNSRYWGSGVPLVGSLVEDPSAAPEPGTIGMMLAGGIALLALNRRRIAGK